MAGEIPARPNMFSASVPLLQIAWDATSLDALQRCPRYYQHSILEGWRKDADTINFGLWFHNALECYERAVIAGEESEDALALAIAHALAEAGTQNPSTGEVIARVQTASRADYDRVVEQSQEAFQRWQTLPAPRCPPTGPSHGGRYAGRSAAPATCSPCFSCWERRCWSFRF